jgi:hypothetical protein
MIPSAKKASGPRAFLFAASRAELPTLPARERGGACHRHSGTKAVAQPSNGPSVCMRSASLERTRRGHVKLSPGVARSRDAGRAMWRTATASFGGPAASAALIQLRTGLLVELQELGEPRPRSGTSPPLRLSRLWECARFSMAAAIDSDRQTLSAVSPRRCLRAESSRKGRCCRAIWALSRARPVAGRLSDGGRGGAAWVRRAPLRSCCGSRVSSS